MILRINGIALRIFVVTLVAGYELLPGTNKLSFVVFLKRLSGLLPKN
jgi:hypothetical protein